MANPENAAENTYDLALSEHETESNVELDPASGGGEQTISFDVKKAYDEVRVMVEGASGNYTVMVHFDNTSVELTSGSSSNIETTQKIFSNSTVDVVITDESGVSNAVDYDILLL